MSDLELSHKLEKYLSKMMNGGNKKEYQWGPGEIPPYH